MRKAIFPLESREHIGKEEMGGGIMIGSPAMKIGISICEKKEKYDTEGRTACPLI